VGRQDGRVGGGLGGGGGCGGGLGTSVQGTGGREGKVGDFEEHDGRPTIVKVGWGQYRKR